MCIQCGTRKADKKANGKGFRPTCTTCRLPSKKTKYDPDKKPKRPLGEYPVTPHDRPLCRKCGVRPCAKQGSRFGLKVDGTPYYRTECSGCLRAKKPSGKWLTSPYRKAAILAAEKMHCTRCGFEPEDPIQIEVDHIDGNRKNSALENLQLLCANCHRLKTYRAGEHKKNRRYLTK